MLEDVFKRIACVRFPSEAMYNIMKAGVRDFPENKNKCMLSNPVKEAQAPYKRTRAENLFLFSNKLLFSHFISKSSL